MADKIGYLEESEYVTDGNVIRHGDVLRDMHVDQGSSIRVLGMIGLCDTTANQSEVVAGSSPLAYMVLSQNGAIVLSKVRYTNFKVKVYGFDPELLNVRQAIRVQMHGFTALSVITLV